MARSLRRRSAGPLLAAALCAACGQTNTIDFSRFDSGVADAGPDAGPDGGGLAFAVGGTVDGLLGTGLVLASSDGDTLAVSSNGPFAFPTRIPDGAAYSVAVQTQPASPLQTCTIAGAAGNVASADVTSVAVVCATNPSFAVGGTVTGLSGRGLLLENNGGDTLALTGDGPFSFATELQSGSAYLVTVVAQPFAPYQHCTAAGAAGLVSAADVTSVQVTCVDIPQLNIGGAVSGLLGSGLVLQDDGVDDLPVSANGSFTFATQLQESAPYRVTVKSQPSAPLQTCTVAQGSGVVGKADVTSVQVSCVTNPSFTIGGTVAGLSSTGLRLQDNGGDDLAIGASGAFTFAHGLQATQAWRASVSAQPAGQLCAVTAGGAGTVGAGDVTFIAVSCASTPFLAVQVQVSGLSGSGLLLSDNGTDPLPVTANGTATFANWLAAGQSYSVTVARQPSAPAQTCVAGSGSAGTAGSNAIIIALQCTTNPFHLIKATVSGLTGTGLLLADNGGDFFSPAADGPFSFATQLQGGDSYFVSVAQQPIAPSQSCAVTNGRGTVGATDVASITIACATSPFFLVGGTVGGLTSAGLTLQDNGGNDVAVSANGLFIFTTLLQTGQAWSVSVGKQPAGQTCTVVNGRGTIASANALGAQVTCRAPPAWPVGGAITGLAGSGLVLTDNGADPLTPTRTGTFTFATRVAEGKTFSVAVKTQPVNPTQLCAVYFGAGVVAAPGVSAVSVVCTTSVFSVGGSVTGLPTGATVTLQDKGATDTGAIAGTSADGSAAVPFTFNTRIASNGVYAAGVARSTGPVSCSVASGGSGAVTAANVTSVAISCVPGFALSGTLAGLTGSGLKLTNGVTGESLSPAKGATSFAFAQAVTQAQGYAISVSAQPTGPSQTCTAAPSSAPLSGNPAANVTTLSFTCATNTYAVGGTVAGLPAGASITLQDNNADNTVVTGAGDGSMPVAFTFNTQVASGSGYAAKALSSTGPVGGCAVLASGSGTVGAGAVSNVQVGCSNAWSIGGAISGYTGSTLALTLTLNSTAGTQTLAVPAGATSFSFPTLVTQAQGYAVTVKTQPAGQVCAFSPGPPWASGAPAANVTGLLLLCSSTHFAIGGSVSGLPAGASVTLLDNRFDTVTVAGTASGTAPFTFPTQLASGQSYAVSVSGSSAAVSCSVSGGGTGSATAAVSTVQIACVPAFAVGGTLAGYAGTGLQLINATTGETITVAKGAATFSFTRTVSTATGYSISVATAPVGPAQACAPSGGSPAAGMPSGAVSDIGFTCTTSSYAVGGTVTGLPAGASVTLANGIDSYAVAGAGDGGAPAAFALPTAVQSGKTYSVSVASTTGHVVCSVANGSGAGTVAAAAVSSVGIACIPGFFIGGTLSLYAGSGLQLTNGATAETITVAAGQSLFAFTKPVSAAQGYAVSVKAQPAAPSQSCSVLADSPSPASGKTAIDVSNIALVCKDNTFTVGGTVSGLPAAASVTLLDNGVDRKVITGADAGLPSFSFPTQLASGQSYAATVVSSTGGVVCTLAGGAGQVGSAAVTSLQVSCAPSFNIGGTVSALAGSGLLLGDATTQEALRVPPQQGSFAFKVPVSQAQGYALSVLAQPVNPVQRCAVSPTSPAPAAGNPGADVTSIALTCTTSPFPVGGVVTGLTGTGLLLENNGVDDVLVGQQTPGYPGFIFAAPVPSGQSYSVSVRRQPSGQLCAARAGTGTGTVGAGPVSSVVIDCLPAALLGGKVTGYLGSGLALSDGIESLPITAAGGADLAFTFRAPLAQGEAYRAQIEAQPQGPFQTCTVQGGSTGGGSGTIASGDDLSLVVACGPARYRIGGTLEGVANGASDALVLADNGVDQVILSCAPGSAGTAAPFNFPVPIESGMPYAVTVLTPPGGLACQVRNSSGAVGTSDVTSVQVVCGYALSPTFDIATVNGVPGEPPPIGLSIQDTIAPGGSGDPYTDSEQLAVPAGAASFALQEPVPYGRTCALAFNGTHAGAGFTCFVEATAGCDGQSPVTAQPAPLLRCAPDPALSLVPFAGASGSAQALAVDAGGNVAAAGAFTGTVDLGHGPRTGSSFPSGSSKVAGSGFVAAFDSRGHSGSRVFLPSENWDRLFPSPAAAKANQGAVKVRAIAEDASGNLIVGGSFIGSVDFGDGLGPFNAGTTESMFLARLGAGGSVTWAHPFGAGAIASLAVSGTAILAGGVYGTAAGTETFSSKTGSTQGCAALTAATAHRDFIAAFDSNAGGCSFSIDIGAGADPNSLPLRLGPAVALDSAGNAVAAGNSPDTNGPTHLAGPYLLTFDATGGTPCQAGGAGNELFQDAAKPANDLVTSVAVGAHDALYVGGACQGSPKLQGSVVSGCGATAPSAFVAAWAGRAACTGARQLTGLQTSGAVATLLGAGGASQLTALAADGSGALSAAGSYSGAPAFGGTALFAGSAALKANVFFLRLTSTLALSAAESLNAANAISLTAIAPGPAGTAWASGAYSGAVTYRGTTTLGTTAAAAEPVLIQFTPVPP